MYPRLGPDLIEKLLHDSFDANGDQDGEPIMFLGEDEYSNYVENVRDYIERSNQGYTK